MPQTVSNSTKRQNKIQQNDNHSNERKQLLSTENTRKAGKTPINTNKDAKFVIVIHFQNSCFATNRKIN